MAKRKTYRASFKAKVAVEAIKAEQAVEGMAETFSEGSRSGGEASQEARIKELHAKIGELTVERDFLAKAFGR